LTGSLAKVNTQ